MNNHRIGIFRGTFDPIHEGHITFAEDAVKLANLDKIYFLVEPRPLHKISTADFKHRFAAVVQAIKPHKNLQILDLNIPNLNASRIIPSLRQIFADATLVFLMGSDVAKTMPGWVDADVLCKNNEIIIALRGQDNQAELEKIIGSLPITPSRVTIIDSPLPNASSTAVRKLDGI